MNPLQLCVMCSRIANGKTALRPRLVKSVGGKELPRGDEQPALTQAADHFDFLHKAMLGVTSEGGGTANGKLDLSLGDIKVAGKTGTAQAHGYQGGRESLAFYKTLFPDYGMGVEEQVTEGNRVASRWVLNGTYHGRAVVLRGITISRLDEDGRTVEDRGHSDSIALLGQIGVIRTFILALEILTRRVKLPKGALKGH